MEDIAAPAEPAAAPAEKPAEPGEPAAAPSEASPSDQEAAAPAAAAPSRSRSRSPGPAKKERNDGKTEVGRQVYVGNLAFSSDKAMIEDKFGVFGKVTDVFLPMDVNHKPRGFAFVTFSEAREAEDCAENLNDKEFDGRVVRVNIARPRPARDARPRGPPRRRDDYDGPRGGGPRGGGYGYRDDFRDRPPPPNRIYVYGLPDDIREREIDDLYYRYGRIDYIEIRRSAKMYAVVCYFEPRDADYAQRETDGMRFERKILRVDLDR